MGNWWYTGTICVLCILTYWNSLYGDMVFDDIPAIVSNRDVRQTTPLRNIWHHDFWGTPIHLESSHKSYRPLCVLTFRLNYAFSRLSTPSYHFVNIVLHTIVCLLFQRLCEKFLRFSERTSFLASLLFAIHPIHTEAVSSIVGRAELLSAVFYSWALISISHVREDSDVAGVPRKAKTSSNEEEKQSFNLGCLRAVALACLGCLCKEQCFAFFPLSALYLYFKQNRCGNKINGKPVEKGSISIIIASSVFLLAVRIFINGGHLPKFSRLDNPIADSTFGSRLMSKAHWSVLNAWLLLFPADLCCDWTSGSLSPITSLKDYRNLATALAAVSVGGLLLSALRSKKRGRSRLLSVAMIFIPYLPASNWFLPVGFVLAERTLYLPSMGICALLADGARTILEIARQRRVARLFSEFMLGCLLLSHVVKSVKRNQDWSNEFTLFKSGLEIVPKNTKLLNNYGKILEKSGRYSEALVYYEKAISIQEKDVRSYINAGNLLHSQSFSLEAENYLKKAITIVKSVKHSVSTTELRAFVYLSNIVATNKSRLTEAFSFINEALDLRSDFSAAYIQKGELLIKMNRSSDAVKMFKNALDLDLMSGKLSNPSFLNNYGALLLEMRHDEEALQAFSKALSQDPNLQSAHINLALLVQETQSEMTRNAAINKLQELAQQSYEKDLNETLYFRLGMLALDRSSTIEAKNYFEKALGVNPTFRSALYNLSLLLTRENKVNEAIGFLERLIKYHPDHVNGRKLLNKIKDSQ